MYTFEHVSPSQIETWLGCNRQWYWQYPMGIKPPPTASNLVGSACHTIAEDFIQEQNGEDLSVKRDGKDHHRSIVRPSMSTLHMLRLHHKAGLGHVERSMKRKLRNGLNLVGRIDFLSLPETDNPLVVDHKTTSSLQYAKTEEELASNIQMLAYAYEAVCLKPLAKAVRVAHNVMLTRGAPAARYTDALISVKDVHAGWTRIQDISDKMIETSKLASPADVPPNLSACDRFGGCFHRDRCSAIKAAQNPNASPYDGIASASTQENTVTTALPAHLLAKLGVKTPNTTPVPAVGGVAPAAPGRPAIPAALAGVLGQAPPPARPASGFLPPETPMNPRDAKAQAAAVVAPALEGAALLQSLGWSNEEIDAMTDDCFESAVDQKVRREGVDIALGAAEADGFRPVEGFCFKPVEVPAAPARRSRTAAPAPVVEVVAEPSVSAIVATQAAAEQDPLVTEHGFTVTVVPAAEAPKRRGRPPGAKNKPKDGEVEVVEAPATVLADTRNEDRYIGGESTLVDDAPAAPVAGLLDEALARIAELERDLSRECGVTRSLTTMLEEKVATEPDQFVLYIDCLPETPGVAFRHLDTVLAPFMDLVAKGFKNEKTGAPEPLSHYALVPFARGPGLVAAHVLTNLAAVTAPGILYVDTRSPCAAAVLEVLRPKADLIVSARGR